jgi:hypothetical protein
MVHVPEHELRRVARAAQKVAGMCSVCETQRCGVGKEVVECSQRVEGENIEATAWLELLCRHIPDRYEHLVRYVGWYSNRSRGERERALKDIPATPAAPLEEPVSAVAARAKAAWARLIRKVYEADPLECPKCQGPMRVIALIDDAAVVRRILEHLGCAAPEPAARGPPVQAPEWPANAVIPLTYHPVPDIA